MATPQMPQSSSVPPPPPGEGLAPDMNLGRYLTAAWNLVTKDIVLFIVGYLVVLAILAVSSLVIVGPIVLGGPLLFGYVRVVQARLNNQPAAFGDLFQGFKDFGKAFVTVLLLALIGLGVGIVNIILMLIPIIGILAALALGIVFGAMIFFVMPIAALSEVSPVQAISRSIKFCFANFWKVLLLSFVLGLIAAAGGLGCGVGALLTVPLALAAGVVAYNEYYLPKAVEAV